MHCRVFRGLAGALFTLLCVGLLSLRYPSSPLRLNQPNPGPLELQLGDIFIAVKTTRAFHRSRLDLLLDTWVSRTRQQVTGVAALRPEREGESSWLRGSQGCAWWSGEKLTTHE